MIFLTASRQIPASCHIVSSFSRRVVNYWHRKVDEEMCLDFDDPTSIIVWSFTYFDGQGLLFYY